MQLEFLAFRHGSSSWWWANKLDPSTTHPHLNGWTPARTGQLLYSGRREVLDVPRITTSRAATRGKVETNQSQLRLSCHFRAAAQETLARKIKKASPVPRHRFKCGPGGVITRKNRVYSICCPILEFFMSQSNGISMSRLQACIGGTIIEAPLLVSRSFAATTKAPAAELQEPMKMDLDATLANDIGPPRRSDHWNIWNDGV